MASELILFFFEAAGMSDFMKFKSISFKHLDNESYEGFPLYRIIHNKTRNQLGTVFYYKSYKQYVFSAREECVFAVSCLSNTLEFLKEINKK